MKKFVFKKSDLKLVETVLKHIQAEKRVRTGLCWESNCLCLEGILTEKQYWRFKDIVGYFKPVKRWEPHNGFYWEPDLLEPRVKYLKQVLRKIKKGLSNVSE